ncbi:hypothetical protein AXE65_12940 [Ventosimonas gracilis]|uniref:Major facilitator superfamily (MFS) profile domain-containing protein n=1 Tax=Ventosimonas gracilis TaxID=1680762 RepID=A0A139SV64_9GAMM|nr:MFS transporter [Ventosimonas gracilis]KXU38477.1 hypothetical protein AXE65_12940 [Ventosimonas gracilis]
MEQNKTLNDSIPRNPTGKEPLLLWVGFILVALNLRIIFASVGPLLQQLNLDLSSTLLVTTLPPLLLGMFSVVGLKLRHYLGEERAMLVALVCLTLGCALRGLGSIALLAGTVIGSMGVATMSVIMPVLVRKRFAPEKMGLVMGLYALMLGLGAVLAAGASFPLYTLQGADTTAAFRTLGWWSIPALLALVFWLPQARFGHDSHQQSGGSQVGNRVNVYRSPLAWSVTLFFGLQALNLYAFLAWLPTIYIDRGTSAEQASFLLAASQLSLTVGGFIAPLLAAKATRQYLHIAATVLLCLVGSIGVMWAPVSSALIWVLLLGFGQGAGPSLGAFLFVARSANRNIATELSAMAQTVGFLIAATGPLLMGILHDVYADWQIPIGLICAITVLELIVALPAGAARRLGEDRAVVRQGSDT